MVTNRHECSGDLPEDSYGPAISECVEDDVGAFWAGNGEFASQVNFCPFCGERAPTQVDEIRHFERSLPW